MHKIIFAILFTIAGSLNAMDSGAFDQSQRSVGPFFSSENNYIAVASASNNTIDLCQVVNGQIVSRTTYQLDTNDEKS